MATPHWIRIALVAGAAVTAIGTCLPWLVGVPPGVLTIGSGTILGITTLHGAIVVALMAAVVAIALRSPREVAPRRVVLAGTLVIAFVALVVASFVLGTSKAEIFDELDRAAVSPDLKHAAILAAAKALRGFDMGAGAYPVVGGLAIIALASIAGVVIPRSAKRDRRLVAVPV